MTHLHDDYETALDDTWRAAVPGVCDDIEVIAAQWGSSYVASTADQHRAAIRQYFSEHAAEFFRAVAADHEAHLVGRRPFHATWTVIGQGQHPSFMQGVALCRVAARRWLRSMVRRERNV